MKLLITVTFLALVLAGCGKSSNNATANNSANAKNSNVGNASNSSSETNTNTDVAAGKDLTPITMSVSEMVSSDDKENEGRMVTVTGGQLEKITYDSLLIRSPGGYGFYCYGEFSDYTKMADRIESLSAQGKAPTATVKGIYKLARTGTGGELTPCVLTDMQK